MNQLRLNNKKCVATLLHIILSLPTLGRYSREKLYGPTTSWLVELYFISCCFTSVYINTDITFTILEFILKLKRDF